MFVAWLSLARPYKSVSGLAFAAAVLIVSCLLVSSGYAQTYLDERKVVSFYTHARGFIARERLYVAFDYSATLFAEIAPPVAFLSLEEVIEDICPFNHPATSKVWVGGYALIRGKLVGGDTVLYPVEWLRSEEQKQLVLSFALLSESCEPDSEEPEEPIEIQPDDIVEVFLFVDEYFEDTPMKIQARVDFTQEPLPSDILGTIVALPCIGNESSNQCKWIREGNPCLGRHDGEQDFQGCARGSANVNAAMICIHGSGYANACVLEGTELSPVTSYGDSVTLRHIPGRGTPPHKAKFHGEVRARLRLEVRRQSVPSVFTSVAGAAAYARYEFRSSPGADCSGTAIREIELSGQVGQQGRLVIVIPPREFSIELSQGESLTAERTIILEYDCCNADYLSLLAETGAGIKIRVFSARASACLKMSVDTCFIRGTCGHSSGDKWNIRAKSACCDANDRDPRYQCREIE